ncbi:pentapeptide repeat-containing protein [Pedobacter montanisoli]|uniref:Pentapeptide repeat-containing protein n=1 Tax=Pedobacter montanisoli TaxID=2923277 RepID=A0ABS9ZSR9_9SPHI|nr:pentapeptide repeat-containing protein [Pedobacter montanisoli]MCJ0741417.1 pentapeptide repeat-containing protein [Pedobacter montanisoli]
MSSEKTTYYSDTKFVKTNLPGFSGNAMQFENCIFSTIDFSEINLNHCAFVDCEFEYCNLSMLKFNGSILNNVTFKDSKLTGVDFSRTNETFFSVNFYNCLLDYAVFFKRKNKKGIFKGCSLIGADFTEADLSEAIFEGSNLDVAVFMQTNLSGADFRQAVNFVIDPEQNLVKKARFELWGLPGLLAKYGLKIDK